jgi:hypothetical protein
MSDFIFVPLPYPLFLLASFRAALRVFPLSEVFSNKDWEHDPILGNVV